MEKRIAQLEKRVAELEKEGRRRNDDQQNRSIDEYLPEPMSKERVMKIINSSTSQA